MKMIHLPTLRHYDPQLTEKTPLSIDRMKRIDSTIKVVWSEQDDNIFHFGRHYQYYAGYCSFVSSKDFMWVEEDEEI